MCSHTACDATAEHELICGNSSDTPNNDFMAKHILTIDDEIEIRELLSLALTDVGFRVTSVGSAAAALEVVQRDPPQLIITDLQLEESDGFELAGQVKQVAPNIPVIMLTGVLFDRDVARGPAWQNIAAYLPKTQSLEQILQAVKKQLLP